jgi:hypothetical protein
MEGRTSPPEDALRLWMLAAAPTIWAVHFLLSYITAAVWCARFVSAGGPLGGVPTAIGVYTAAALVGIAVVGWMGWRQHSGYGTATAPHDFDTPEDRQRFLGFATLLLAGVSAVATIYVSLGAVFFESCR